MHIKIKNVLKRLNHELKATSKATENTPDPKLDMIHDLSKDFNCVLISVEYRLALGNPFTIPLEDVYLDLKMEDIAIAIRRVV